MVDHTSSDILLGWGVFCSELSTFLTSAGRQFGSATYEYVVERLEMCIMRVSRLINHLEIAQEVDVDSQSGITQVSTELTDLLGCFHNYVTFEPQYRHIHTLLMFSPMTLT